MKTDRSKDCLEGSPNAVGEASRYCQLSSANPALQRMSG